MLGTESQGRRGMQGRTRGPLPPPNPPNCLSAQCVFNALHHCTSTTLASVMYPCCCLTFGCSRPPFWHVWASLSFSLPPSLSPTNCDPPFRLYSHFLSFDSLFQPLGHCRRGTVSLGFVPATATRPPSLVPSHCIAPQPKRADPYETIEPFHAPDPSKQTDETLSSCAWILPVTWIAAEGQHWPLSIAVTLSIPTVSRPRHSSLP